MEITPSRYPDNFPCPTWQYGEAQSAFPGRTPFECGWTRQRRKSLDPYVHLDLAFSMPTLMYSKWSTWVNANAYSSWFLIPLDKYEGVNRLTIIRFKSVMNVSYSTYNKVIVSVAAEVYQGKPNPDKLYNPGGGHIVCYTCNALNGALSDQGFTVVLSLSPPDGAFPWPFATMNVDGTGQPGAISAWNSYVTSANLQTDWGGSVVVGPIDSWDWYDEAALFKQCENGEELSTQAVHITGNPSVFAMSVPAQGGPSESSALNIVFTGYLGGDNANGEIWRGPTTYWSIYRDNDVHQEYYSNPGYCNLSAIVSGGDHQIQVNTGTDDGASIASMNIGPVGGQWLNLICHEESWYDIVVDGLDKHMRLWTKITATVTAQDGSGRGTVSAEGYILRTVNNQAGYAEAVPPVSLYTCPSFFYGTGGAITISSMSFGITIPDLEYVSTLYINNFSNHSPCT